MTLRGRVAIAALLVVLIYLLTDVVSAAEENRDLQKRNAATLATLTKTNDGIVAKLTEVFTQMLQVPGQVDRVVESLKGYVDPKLIQQAIEAARKAVVAKQGPPGPPGPPGPAGATVTTTSGGPVATTSTTRPPATTTTSTARPAPTTTTTRRCTATVGNLVKIGC